MKVYVGIKQTNSDIYMAALNSQGKTVLKSFFPSTCPSQTIINALEAFQQAFCAHLRIATCLENDLQHSLLQHSLLNDLQKKFHFVRPLDSSVYYRTDFFPEEQPYVPADTPILSSWLFSIA